MTLAILATPARPAGPEAPGTLGALLEHIAGLERGNCTGLRFLDRREREIFRSWREVAEGSRDLALGLAALGIESGERVALIFPTGPEFFDAFFGTLLAGAVPCPLYPPFRLGKMDEYEERTAAMLEAVEAVVVLADGAVRRLLGGVLQRYSPPHGCRSLAEMLEQQPVPSPAPLAVEPSDLGLVQFSSGTTGSPKPVGLSHAAILHQASLLGGHWPDREGLRHSGVSWLPLYHDMGLIGCVFPALQRPADLTLIGPETFVARPASWLRAISRYRATISPAPNFAYSLCAERIRDSELEGVDLSCWRAALNGAESVAAPVLRAFNERFSKWGLRPEALAPVYGLAEAALAVTFSSSGRMFVAKSFDSERLAAGVAVPIGAPPTASCDCLKTEAPAIEDSAIAALGAGDSSRPWDQAELIQSQELVSVGSPVPGFEIEVRGPDGGVIEVGRVGTIHVLGPSLMNGYCGDETLYDEVVCDGWLDTGDLGFVLDGELYLTGRAKDVLVVHGRNHSPEPVERSVSGLPEIRTGCVVAVGFLPAGASGEQLWVLAELRRRGLEKGAAEAGPIEDRALRKVLAECGLRVNRLVLLEPGALPRASSGKLRRQDALRALLAGELEEARTGFFGRLKVEVARRPALQAARALARSKRAYWRSREGVG